MKKNVRILSIVSVIILCLCCSCSGGNKSEDSIFDFKFKINENTFALPEKISVFTENGFTFPENFDLEKSVTPGNLESTFLTLDSEENWINVEIFNYGEQETALKDCPVGRVIYYFEGALDIYTAGDFHLNGKTLDDVLSEYGEPFSKADYSTYTEVIYDKDPSSGIYDRYTFRFDIETKVINYIDITMFY